MLLRIDKNIMIRKMPPLPNRKHIPNASNKPLIELISNRMLMPQRYNSIERPRKAEKELTEEQENKGDLPIRKNYHVRRPVSARQNSERRDFSK